MELVYIALCVAAWTVFGVALLGTTKKMLLVYMVYLAAMKSGAEFEYTNLELMDIFTALLFGLAITISLPHVHALIVGAYG